MSLEWQPNAVAEMKSLRLCCKGFLTAKAN